MNTTLTRKNFVPSVLPMMESKREVYQCQDNNCRVIQAHDFIPYGLGRGVWYNPCMCHATDSNWIFRAKKLATYNRK